VQLFILASTIIGLRVSDVIAVLAGYFQVWSVFRRWIEMILLNLTKATCKTDETKRLKSYFVFPRWRMKMG